jgi:hypothetical protein
VRRLWRTPGPPYRAAGIAGRHSKNFGLLDPTYTQLEERKGVLAKLLRETSWGVQLNEHIAERGDIVFRHACRLGFEGIVSKRLGSPYVSGRSRHWIKSKNPPPPAAKREAGEDGGANDGDDRSRPGRSYS